MSRSARSLAPGRAPATARGGPGMRGAALALAALAAAVAVGVTLFVLLMSPGRRDLADLALYLVITGLATLAAGWAALRTSDARFGLSLRAKAFLAATVGSAVGLVNVYVIARLMFVSTTHDLPLLVTVLVFSGVLAVFFSLLVAATVTDRVRTIAGAIRGIAAGDYDTRITLDGGDELVALAADVDQLADRLQAAERQRDELARERRELTAAISHDLRTPLASFRAMVEALSDGVVEPPEVDRYLRTMRREIDRLGRMLDDLFELAQIDAGALRLDRRPLTVQEIVMDVADAMQALAAQAQVALEVDIDAGGPPLAIDGARMERAVANLVRNALEHTRAGGRIALRVAAGPRDVAVTVEDDGEGIPADVLSHVWERFYRGDRSRTRGSGSGDGAGLGLAIVRGIVEAHGGTVEARSTPGTGSAFTIRLPV
ncbi:MAG: HAMP domain-containing sensor histidine kinase [Dehalococcoidia bacterium]